MRRSIFVLIGTVAMFAATAAAPPVYHVGPQPDGSYIVATGQRVEAGAVTINARPIAMALHPSGAFFAVLAQNHVELATAQGVIPGTLRPTMGGCSYRGCIWSADGTRLYVSLASGRVQSFRLEGQRLDYDRTFSLVPAGDLRNPVPGGMSKTRDGRTLFVACANRGAVVEVDLTTGRRVRDWPVQNIPFDARLSEDENTLIVSNWGGRTAREREATADSDGVAVVVDKRGIPSSGTVSLIDRSTGHRTDVPVGLHPCGLAVQGGRAWVANAGSDTISEIDIARAKVTRTFRIMWEGHPLFGSMPNSLCIVGNRLYACDAGDNALCVMDVTSGRVLGFRPTGYCPVGINVSPDGQTLYVVNTLGNGSVRQPRIVRFRNPGHNTHDIQGSISVVRRAPDLPAATERVAQNNGWRTALEDLNPDISVYRGAIEHVLYVIKENRTYDQILGDMKQGNGDASLCGFGQYVTPNEHALAREFGLFDNAYACGTNSAEGHQWAMEGLANEYIERFYGGYSRSYPYDGGDPMAYASTGFIWDAARRKGKSVRIYGEFCKAGLATFTPKPKSWTDAWQDRATGANRIDVRAGTTVAGMRPLIHRHVICWPLIMSDQWRADQFIADYQRLSSQDRVPNLMILTLPCDHTEGMRPGYPTPRAMIADNDRALGRVVEAISHSPQWKETCIFVMEDDAQAGFDHVDGHRTVCFAISPYSRRGWVDSTLYTQPSILRSIELMLDIDPMNRFDALATPFAACFSDTPDLRTFRARRNRIPLDELNKPLKALRGDDLYWAKRSAALDWSDVDRADWSTLNRVLWHTAYAGRPYPVE